MKQVLQREMFQVTKSKAEFWYLIATTAYEEIPGVK